MEVTAGPADIPPGTDVVVVAEHLKLYPTGTYALTSLVDPDGRRAGRGMSGNVIKRGIGLAVEEIGPKLATMLHWFCPGCGVPGWTGLPDRVDALCGFCAAAATWKQLPASTQKMIDDAIRRGNVLGLLAMRAADPPIRLPHATDVLAFRHRAGVHPDTPG